MHVIPFKLLILQTQNMCKSKAQDENRFPCSCSRSLCSWNWLNFFCRHCRRWIADVSAPLWANVQNDLLTVHIVCISRCFFSFSFSPFHNNKCDPIFVNKRIVRSHMWAHMIINSTHSTQRACVYDDVQVQNFQFSSYIFIIHWTVIQAYTNTFAFLIINGMKKVKNAEKPLRKSKTKI